MHRLIYKLAVVSVLLLGLPLAGVVLAGRPVARYLEFPPLTRYVAHAPFSWTAFVLVGGLALALFAGLAWLVVPRRPRPRAVVSGGFPWWGWAALVLLAGSWLLAWTRFPWFRDLQPHTFTPLWLGYILVVNALTHRRTGRSLATHRPRYLLALFPTSALFWWYFEYLNRFVQNWHYVGTEDFSPTRYALHATLAFATVLPAVISTLEWLRSFPALANLDTAVALPSRHAGLYASAALVIAGAGLAGLGVWPDYLFPLVWVAPLVLVVALQVLAGEPTIFAGPARGDWRMVALSALAALMCGFLWELWNYYSYAKWVYAIPFVHRFTIFEMPLLGYTGYLPFGLECAVIAGLVDRRRH